MKKSILLNNIIFILFSIICILLMYICSKVIVFSNSPHTHKPPYANNILNKSEKEYVPPNAVQVIYKLDNINEPVNGISKADLILEYINSQNKLVYKALYFNEKFTKNTISDNCLEVKNFKIPKFNFNNNKSINLKGNTANFVYINLNDYFSSNFIFKNNYYYHYKPKTKHMDNANKEPVKVSNIIVQIVNKKDDKENIKGTGDGFLFSNGKVKDIRWNKTMDSPVKITDKHNNDVKLTKGTTWWVILDDRSLISYN